MKKTFLAMLLLGGTVSMFAQNTQPTTPTQGNNPTTNPPTTTQPTTTQPTTTSPTSTMSGNTTTTNQNLNNATNPSTNNNMNNANATNANSNWNGVSASTSWTPETPPAYSWNSYSVWPNSGSLYPSTTAGGFPIVNTTTDASASMSSTGTYSAYAGTPVSALPANVQMRFSQDFPAGAGNSYTWNQYGDWFHTYYTKDGRLWQYYYTQRGDGYALALPVIETYVPENIINSALQKYGSSLYSIGMVKTNSGNNAYQIGLIQKGQLTSQYFDENGATVADVWRVEDSASMSSTQSNAAMDNSTSADANMQSTDAHNQQNSDANAQQPAEKEKSKMKIKHADGSEMKIKTKDGETKGKTKPASSTSNDQPQQQ